MPTIIEGGPKLYDIPEIRDIREMIRMSMKRNNNPTSFKVKDITNGEKFIDIPLSRYIEEYEAFGSFLLKKGYHKKRIAILAENRYEWAIAYAAIACGIGIVVPIDKSLPLVEIENMFERSEVEVVVTSKKHLSDLKSLIGKENIKLKDIYVMDLFNIAKDDLNIDLPENVYSMKASIEEGKKIIEENDEYRYLDIDNKALGVLLFTSATTSKSKAVMLSHENIVSNIRDIASVFDIGPNDRVLSFLPLHHSFECTVGFLAMLFFGATICYAESIRKLADNIKEYQVTCMISVPLLYESIYSKIMKSIKKQGKDKIVSLLVGVTSTLKRFGIDKRREVFAEIHKQLGGKLRLLVSGAAALNPATQKGFQDFGIELHQGYGLSETSPVIAAGYSTYDVVGSVGRVFPSVQLKIDKNENDTIGEILVKGPNIMLGYLNDEEANKQAFTSDGWFRTGDLGYLDENNYLYISGRAKNVIVLKNGKNIFPDETETLFLNIPGVTETMVFGYPLGEDETDITLMSKIVYDSEYFKGKDEEEIKEEIWEQVKQINKTQPLYKYVKKIFITKEPLIKTTTQKVKRYEEMGKIKEEIEKEKIEKERNKKNENE